MAHLVTTYPVTTYLPMAYIIMAYRVMAYCLITPPRYGYCSSGLCRLRAWQSSNGCVSSGSNTHRRTLKRSSGGLRTRGRSKIAITIWAITIWAITITIWAISIWLVTGPKSPRHGIHKRRCWEGGEHQRQYCQDRGHTTLHRVERCKAPRLFRQDQKRAGEVQGEGAAREWAVVWKWQKSDQALLSVRVPTYMYNICLYNLWPR